MRIVSLLPSTTEILFAIGAGEQVVGVTFECDYPAQARERTIVSSSALPSGLSPAEVDAAVAERMRAGADLYHLDEGAMAGLQADLVITQDLCAVCAVDVSVVDDALQYLGCSAEVLTIDPHDLQEVFTSILTIAEATGTMPAAQRLYDDLAQRVESVRRRVAGHPGPRTAVLEWTDPPFAPGHWVPEMVAAAGGECVVGTAKQQSQRITWSDIAAAQPEVVVAAPCGYGLGESARLARAVVAEGLLPAGIPVWAVDANASYARPGPRLVDGVEDLAAIMHPEALGRPNPQRALRIR